MKFLDERFLLANTSLEVVFGILFDVRVKKIVSIMLDTYRIIVIVFLMTYKAHQVRFFKKTFFLANSSLEVVFKILFLTFSCADIDFLGKQLQQKIYTI